MVLKEIVDFISALALLGNVILSIFNLIKSRQTHTLASTNTKNIADLADHTNSIKDALVEETAKSEYTRGLLEGAVVAEREKKK